MPAGASDSSGAFCIRYNLLMVSEDTDSHSAPATENRVFVNDDDIIEFDVIGDQTPKSVIIMGETAGKLARQQWADGKRALMLDDLRKIGNWAPGTLRRVITIAKTISYDKLAMVSGQYGVKAGSNFVLMAIGKYNKVRFFEDRDAATKWLKKDD
jgi:hypothetical protein